MKTYPLSRTQLGLVLAEQNAHGNENYNQISCARLGDDVDIETLKIALGKVFDNHPIFKTRLAYTDDGELCFAFDPDAKMIIREFEEPDIETAKAGMGITYDLFNEPMYRFWIIHTKNDGNVWFQCDIHHLILDGLSSAIFTRDLQDAYHGKELTPETKSIFEITCEESELRKTEVYANAREYYRGTFADAVDLVTFPAEDVTTPVVPEDRQWQELEFPITADRKAIKDMCRKYKVATDIPFYTAFGYVMAKLSNEDKALFATIYNGRSSSDVRNTMGMMVQTYPVFVDYSGGVSLADVMTRMAEQTTASREHTLYSFGEVTSELGIIPKVSIAYHGTLHDPEWIINTERLEYERMITHSPGFSLTFAIVQVDKEFRIRLFHNQNLHSETVMKNICACIDHVLCQMVEGKEFADIQLLGEEQAAEVIALSQGEKLEYDDTKTPVELIMEYAKSTPDAIAVADEDTSLTYAQLDSMTNALAHVLLDNGVQKNQFVGVMMDRSVRFPISAFAIHKAGAAYMPLDVDYPNERLSYMIENSEATVLVTTHAVLEAKQAEGGLNIDGLHIIYLEDNDNCHPDGKSSSKTSPAGGGREGASICLATPDSLAYMIYTSGSTGKPKGAMLHQKGLLNFTLSIADTEQLTADDRIASHRSFSFDAHIGDLYPVLVKGGSLHIMPSKIRKDLDAMYQFIVEKKITGFGCTTSLMMLMLNNYDMPVRFVTAGGEKLSGVESDHIRIINLYGPTECTNDSTLYVIEPGLKVQNIPIGRPLHNMTCLVMSKDGKLLPQGTPGELCIAGVQVGRGYWRLPEKTAEAFVDSPLADGGKLYRTGDLVRWNAEGQLEYLGRIDGQVKLRGFRIEMGEIESTALQVEGIKQVAAAVKEVGGNKRLVLYYTLNDGASVTNQEMSAHIEASTLADYMHPEVYQHLDTMPQLPNGKIDRKHLPDPAIEMREEEEATRELNILEQKLVSMVASLLGADSVGISTSLRSYGMSSLVSMKLAAQLFKQYGIKMKGKELASGSIMDIENAILARTFDNENDALRYENDNRHPDGKSSSSSSLNSAPLSYSQLGVFTECMSHPEDVQYNMPSCVTMPQGVTSPQVVEALKKIFDAHPYLKTHLVNDDNGDTYQCPMQEDIRIPVFKMSEEEMEQEKATFVRPFQLIGGPLCRVEVVETPAGVHLLLDFHHLIMDGGSLDIFYNQLCMALNGKPLEAENYKYYHFVADQKIEPETEEFFANQLDAIEDSSALLPDVYSEDDSHAEAYVKCAIDLNVVESKCLALDITPAALYLAAFMMAVSKYTAEETVGICTISNGRSNVLLSDTFGMFVNTLPLVAKVDSEMTVDDYLLQVSRTFSQTLDNEQYPFAKIAEKYGYAPNILFGYQVGVINAYNCSQGTLQLQRLQLQRAKFPVAVFISGSKEHGGSVDVSYDASLFSQDMMQGLADSVRNIADGLLTKTYVKDVEICNEQMLARLDTFNYNDDYNDSDNDNSETVLTMFQKAAQQYPDNIAVVFKEKKYTYKQLDELTDKIGAFIYNKVKDCGKNEPVVSIIIHRNEWMVLASLATLKAGCAYQPLDPSYPQERLNFMIKDADAALLIADEDLRPIINEYEGEVLLTNDIIEEATAFAFSNSNSLPKGEGQGGASSLFTLLYTSGSTGVPKGVMLEHGNLVAFNKGYSSYLSINSESRIAAYASFGFDANMQDIYCTLMNGATLHIIDEDIRLDLEALHQYFEREGITHSFMTTQVAVQYLENYPQSASLQHLIMGGEKLRAVKPELLSYKIHNGYGPSETTCGCSYFHVEHWEQNIPIGRPNMTCNLYIVDKCGHRLPAGATGELWINGPQVGRGYLNRPDKSAECFTQNPFGEGRVYHSGDIVRYRQDGNIEFVGRKDGQVKIRGFRIELKEVEAVIRDFEGIKDVTVQAFDDPNGGKFIAAYVVSDAQVDVDALNQFILDQKPPYMVPAVTMQIPEIPLTVNQKVDKKALPKPEKAPLQLYRGGENAPLNALEAELKAIIASVVNTEDFGITDILGYVGLTSITSIKLATLIYKRFGIQVNSKTLAKTGSLQSIENEILGKWMNNNGSTGSPTSEATRILTDSLPREGRGGASPLTFAQTGVYFDIVRNSGSISYNMPTLYTFPEGITAEVLEKAVVACLATHKILGTHFEIQGTDVVQVYPENFVPTVNNITVSTKEEFDALKSAFVKPFDPATGPLYRVEIITFGTQVYMFMDTLHLVMDGASVGLFLRQLTDAIGGIEPEQEHYTFFEYAQDEQQLPATPEYAESEQYFTEMLKTVDGVSNITEDLKPQEGAEARLARAENAVDMAKISSAAKSLGVNPSSIFLAAAYYTLSRYTNTQDVCLCTISNGRSNLRISDTIGMFVNTIAIASHIKDVTVKDFILQTSEDFSAALNHEQYPFAKVAEKFDLTPTIFFQYQVGLLDELKVKLPDNTNYGVIKFEGFGESTPKFKFTISIEPKPENGVCVQVQYDDTLYSPQLAQGFSDAMVAVIEHFLKDVNAPLKHVSMLNDEQAALIATFHETKQAEVPIKLYHKLFEQSVEVHADELALVALNPYTNIYESYTYARLNECMNRIAHSLIARGVQPRDRVAILLPRTSRLIMSQYAILKAGGAYIPCDPKYPTERINLILEDSESRFIITTKDRLAEFPDRAIDVEELLDYPGIPVSPDNPELPETPENLGNTDVAVEPDDLAYLIYTSGSTGRPKGVQLMHKGVCNYHCPENIIQSCLQSECHAALGITTISFDMSVWETGSPLMLGKTLVLAGDDDCNDPNRLAMLIDSYGIDCMTATTSRYMQLLESPEFEEAFSKHIHLAYQGGEGLSMALLSKLQTYPGIRIFNGYGPTETIANSHAAELTTGDIPHIGKPCCNYNNYIVDNDGNELPVGVVGELLIGGASVAKGYNNLPEQTAARFTPNPYLSEGNGNPSPSFKEREGGRSLYHSGDYARWLPDGNVMVLGRKDNQVKLRGLRIELGEVESAIAKVEGVKNTVVMIKKLQGRDHLCAYFTADRQIDIEEMKSELKKTLTHYMIPTAYLQMDEFPLTPNGKTNTKVLPEPVMAVNQTECVAAANQTEQDFCDIFAEVLELDKVGATDNFFEIGGTSLVAMRVVMKAVKQGYQIVYKDVFDCPTPRDLAQLLGEDLPLTPSLKDGEENAKGENLYDYTAIDALLQSNVIANIPDADVAVNQRPLGVCVVTGATGYLGIHVVKELIDRDDVPAIYCLVRGTKRMSAESRLRTQLFYYFDESYEDLFGTRLFVVEGDVTKPECLNPLEETFRALNGAATVFNCAANVKHFSAGTDIEDINIGGCQTCIDFCLKTGARFIQTSTHSIEGCMISDSPVTGSTLTEAKLFMGQTQMGQYTQSKFLAERNVLEAIATKGLDAKIMRYGNLAARSTDGEFQINFSSNGFMNRLNVYKTLGAIPYDISASQTEFSPINDVAHATVLLAMTPQQFTVFMPINSHHAPMSDVIICMRKLGFKIDDVELKVFEDIVMEAGQDPRKAALIQSLLAYTPNIRGKFFANNNRDNSFTTQMLMRLGFNWPFTTWDYMERMITAIQGLGFFDENYER